MLRKIRIILGTLFFSLITLLFLDFTGTVHAWFGWLAKIQLVPAILAVNVGVVIVLLLLTWGFGRIYCSVICPLGVFQDVISRLSRSVRKQRFSFSPAISWLRYAILGLFIVSMVAGLSAVVVLIEPYSAYGRVAAMLFTPLYAIGNNLLAFFAERVDSYAFYTTDIWLKSFLTIGIAVITLFVIGFLAWRKGRTYCNTICPVGTLLGFISRYSLLKPVIDPDKCTKCSQCSRACKASCIDYKNYNIDTSRCVSCMNCLDKCKFDAIHYTSQRPVDKSTENKKPTRKSRTNINIMEGLSPLDVTVPPDTTAVPAIIPDIHPSENGISRRRFLSIAGLFAVSNTVNAKMGDGGLAVIEEKKIPDRLTPILPPGSLSARHMKQHCTACQLCVSVCPNQILRPSPKLGTFMQPEMSYERGYCRPECTKCSEVCPAGAIKPITPAEKSGIQIGRAVWIKENCVVNRDEVICTACERHCPTGAIELIPRDADDPESLKIPVVLTELCIGCGACENLCPARPFSAIYVEGVTRHITI